MTLIKKFLIGLVLIFVLFIIGSLSYVKIALPDVGDAPKIKIEATPERIARGKYLANHVCVCIDCHSKRDWTKFSGPPIEGTFGMGGECFDQKFGFPGSYHSKNITPFGVKSWTDGELLRAITTGVDKQGNALFPIMPYHYYGQMDEEDVKSIIAYIRILQPVENDPGASSSDFPMNFIINTIPQKANFQKIPNKKTDLIAYGKYLITASGCIECHTKDEKGQIIPELAYSGGREFPVPTGGEVRSGNITPDRETGIGTWSKEQFIALFKARSDSATLNMKAKPGQFNTIMPWTMYSKMTDEDLEAIYTYLRTIKPIKNEVEKFTSAKL